MISALATGYLFLGGAGSGALFALSIMEWLRTLRGAARSLPVFSSELLCRSWTACLLSLSLGVVFLIFDLGNFEAAIYLLMNPQPAALTIGAFSLPVAIVCAAAFLAMDAVDGLSTSIWVVRVLSLVGIIASIVVMGYTGILLHDMASVIAWQSPLIPVLFVLSSLSCGLALILGSIAFVETRAPLAELISRLIHCDSVIIVLEAIALVAFTVSCIQDTESMPAIDALIGGDLAPAFWLGLVGVGLIIPFVMEQLVTFSSHRHQLLFIAAAILVGGLAMRYCIVGLAPYDPSNALTFVNYNQLALPIG